MSPILKIQQKLNEHEKRKLEICRTFAEHKETTKKNRTELLQKNCAEMQQ